MKCATMRLEEAAKYLGVGRTACWFAIQRGEVPAIKIGKSLRIPKAGIDAMLNNAGKQNVEIQEGGENL